MLTVELEVQFQGESPPRTFDKVRVTDLKDGGVVLSELRIDRPAGSAVSINDAVDMKLGALVEGGAWVCEFKSSGACRFSCD